MALNPHLLGVGIILSGKIWLRCDCRDAAWMVRPTLRCFGLNRAVIVVVGELTG